MDKKPTTSTEDVPTRSAVDWKALFDASQNESPTYKRMIKAIFLDGIRRMYLERKSNISK
jgi:hypothetical protein